VRLTHIKGYLLTYFLFPLMEYSPSLPAPPLYTSPPHSIIILSLSVVFVQLFWARTFGGGKGFSYTRCRALGPELIPVYSQSAHSHSPGGRLSLLSARPAVTFPAAEHHRPLAGTKLYCLVTEAHRCEQLDQGCYAALPRVGFEPTTC